jgi:hypothetical protein
MKNNAGTVSKSNMKNVERGVSKLKLANPCDDFYLNKI